MLLIIGGGLNYSYGVDLITTVILEIIVTIAFTLVCMFCRPEFQLRLSKFLTFITSIIMVFVTIGLVTQVCLRGVIPYFD